jgi:hypothetical protein
MMGFTVPKNYPAFVLGWGYRNAKIAFTFSRNTPLMMGGRQTAKQVIKDFRATEQA